ncbi:MAG TPA: aminotransferase class III-fold pyridoxal phosphate-dependent enzyme [Blastocatellia bacterium]|nr:aminotransferase class III-fold pyridoxal phosphate-dependent enzyme [Blastocatellia bacterium]
MRGEQVKPSRRDHPFFNHMNPRLGRLMSQLEMDKVFVRGEGCYLYDQSGRRYLDFLAQYGALPFGFNNPYIWRAVEQVRNSFEPSFVQPSCLEAAGELAKRLVNVAPPGMQYVTFSNSGAEAVEAALKLCRSRTGRMGILAANNGFHGKTLGALSATDKRKYQEGFGAPVKGFDYVPFGDLNALESALAGRFYAAFIVEPIQGEGGIIEAPPGYLAEAGEICRKYGVKLIVDEIQTGLGRTGAMFACETEGVIPDVITVAKALGGGLAPIGACLYKEDVYNDDFALKHTSTFAGNTLACRIGLATLDLLEENDRRLIRQVADNGARLKQELQYLKQKYPNVLGAISGRGYMLGASFGANHFNWDSGLLGCLGGTEALTSLVVSRMLTVNGVRLGYTLNHGGVLRIEPPLIATWKECELFLEAFEDTLAALESRNTAYFTAHLTGANVDVNGLKPQVCQKVLRFPIADRGNRFAFLVHPLTVRDYANIDPSLSILSDPQISRLAECVAENFDPFVAGDAQIVSKTGQTAYGEFIVVPRTAEELAQMPYYDAISEVRAAARIAEQRGAKIIGLGAYTSVVTRGGLYLKDDGLPALTTGNSYTTVAAMQSIEAALEMTGRDLSTCCAAVVGATGSIGRAISILLSQNIGKLILIGNPSRPAESRRRLMQVSADILRSIGDLGSRNKKSPEWTLAGATYDLLPSERQDWNNADWIRFATEMGQRLRIIHDACDVHQSLQEADVVVMATNMVGDLAQPEDFKDGAVVCDISRPPNVSRTVRINRPDAFVIEGGVVNLPGGSKLSLNLDIGPGLAYACMAETMILALERRFEDTSLGIDLDMDNVAEMGWLAERHGFGPSLVHSARTPLLGVSVAKAA